MRNICSNRTPDVVPLRGTSVFRAIRGFLEDSSPTAIVVSALRAGVAARAALSFAAFMTALLVPCVLSGAEKKDRGARSSPSFVGTINGHTIQVEFVFGKFDPKKRVVTKRNAKTDAGETYEQILLNGKPILGTDNSDPTPGFGESKPFDIIERILLRWDRKPVEIPQSLFDHVVLPHENTSLREGNQPDVMFIPDPAGNALVIAMTVGDGGGTNRIIWLLRKDGKHRILHSNFLELSN